MVFFMPIIAGFFGGHASLVGLMAGVLVSGFLMAFQFGNTGGALGNVKKYIEKGYFGGPGTSTHAATLVADSVGRCMRMKNGNLWFTTKSGRFNNVFELSFKTKVATLLGMQESEDYCFYNKNDVWSISDNSVVSGFMNTALGAAEIADLSKFGITKPSRITVSPDGKKLAVVSNK